MNIIQNLPDDTLQQKGIGDWKTEYVGVCAGWCGGSDRKEKKREIEGEKNRGEGQQKKKKGNRRENGGEVQRKWIQKMRFGWG